MTDFLKGPWSEYQVPKQKLPCCGYEIDCMSLAVGSRKDRMRPLDELLTSGEDHKSISVCIRCGAWLMVNEDYTQRVMTADDIVDMPDEVREALRKMTAGVRKVQWKWRR